MLTPPLLIVVHRARLPATPFLVTLAMAANAGSVMTLTGNPQNMLVGVYSGWSYGAFFLRMLPVGAVGLAVMIALLVWHYGAVLRVAAQEFAPSRPAPMSERRAPAHDRTLLTKTLLVLAGVLVGFVVTSDLPLVALVGCVALLVWSGASPAAVLKRVNWVLLLFFAGLFIVVRGLETTGIVETLSSAAQPYYGRTPATQIPVFSTLTVIASNVVSNVPFVMLARHLVGELADPALMWLVLAMASTFAGNLTIPGSVATLIVLEAAGESGTVGYFDFLRIGVPITIATTAAGGLVLWCEALWLS
jgi:Na+/H+ antiporter NhaD/arsenite permease-like protein